MKTQLKKAHSKLMQWGALIGTALTMFYINTSFADPGTNVVNLQTMAGNSTKGIESLAIPVIAIIVILAVFLFLSASHGLIKGAQQGAQAQQSTGVHVTKMVISAVLLFSLYFTSDLMYTATGTNVDSQSNIKILSQANTSGNGNSLTGL